jgi:predicted DNA-binding transcriptional regulator AlpA
MRKIRGVYNLADYLKSVHCEMSVSTIQRLMQRKEIPHSRPAPRVIIFDLNEIDEWLGCANKRGAS